MIGAARAKLLGLGSSLAPTLALVEDVAECRAIIDGAVHEVLLELSEFDPETILFEFPSDRSSESGDSESGEALATASEADYQPVG
ncbi:MAG: hypothetical protein WKF37_09040 [Bryobacteraceae bacterium]